MPSILGTFFFQSYGGRCRSPVSQIWSLESGHSSRDALVVAEVGQWMSGSRRWAVSGSGRWAATAGQDMEYRIQDVIRPLLCYRLTNDLPLCCMPLRLTHPSHGTVAAVIRDKRDGSCRNISQSEPRHANRECSLKDSLAHL